MIAPFCTLGIEKSPSRPVMVPLVVPFTTTDAPITVSPDASFTTPVHVDYCVI